MILYILLEFIIIKNWQNFNDFMKTFFNFNFYRVISKLKICKKIKSLYLIKNLQINLMHCIPNSLQSV